MVKELLASLLLWGTQIADRLETAFLAANIYHESRGEVTEGQLCVAYVTIARTKDKNPTFGGPTLRSVVFKRTCAKTVDSLLSSPGGRNLLNLATTRLLLPPGEMRSTPERLRADLCAVCKGCVTTRIPKLPDQEDRAGLIAMPSMLDRWGDTTSTARIERFSNGGGAWLQSATASPKAGHWTRLPECPDRAHPLHLPRPCGCARIDPHLPPKERKLKEVAKRTTGVPVGSQLLSESIKGKHRPRRIAALALPGGTHSPSRRPRVASPNNAVYHRRTVRTEVVMDDWLTIDVRCSAATARLLAARPDRRRVTRTDTIFIHDEQGQSWAWERRATCWNTTALSAKKSLRAF